MSADLLNRAAEVLEAEAKAHEGRTWVWTGVGEHGYPQQVTSLGNAALIAETYNGPDDPHPAAAYIARMHPGVGLALAAWLRGMARHESYFAPAGYGLALAVAREVLGEEG